MNSEKFVALLEKLLEKTKQEKIKWKRYDPDPEWEPWASEERSFSCNTGKMEITMLSGEGTDNIEFDITYDSSLPRASLEVSTDAEHQVALRLLNYVYNQFPNLEKSIDEFLSED